MQIKIKNHLNQKGVGHLLLLLFIVIGVAVAGTYYLVSSKAASKSIPGIVDVSYPQCKESKQIGHYQYGIVGVNGGGNFEKNPCMSKLARKFDSYELYVNSNYPSDGCKTTPSERAAYNCGVKAGKWSYKLATKHHLKSWRWWIDVEEGDKIHWHDNNEYNRQFLHGMAKALSSYPGVQQVGYYSTSLQWGHITGNWQNGAPAWYATGKGKKPDSVLRSFCGRGFNGGYVVFVQYSLNIDRNISCQYN